MWAKMQANLSSVFANDKGGDKPAHPRSLISAFIIPLFEIIISILTTSELSIFYLVSVAEETDLSLICAKLQRPVHANKFSLTNLKFLNS